MSIGTLKKISESIATWKREWYDRPGPEAELDYIKSLADADIEVDRLRRAARKAKALRKP